MSKPAVILLSGGMDSAVCLAIAREQGYKLNVLNFDYGQKNKLELDKAKALSKNAEAENFMLMKLDLTKIGGSALTADLEVPRVETEGVPITYVPGRNLIFLSVATAWAEVLGASSIFIGANIRDYSGYPDCRKEFLESFEVTADLATKDETKISIVAPLLHMTKAEIALEGRRLGVDFSMTSSCYEPKEDGSECGECESCRLRQLGFDEAGL